MVKSTKAKGLLVPAAANKEAETVEENNADGIIISTQGGSSRSPSNNKMASSTGSVSLQRSSAGSAASVKMSLNKSLKSGSVSTPPLVALNNRGGRPMKDLWKVCCNGNKKKKMIIILT
jgi:hypothetical protein